MVGLKYSSATMRCDEVVDDGKLGINASPVELRCTLVDLSAEGADDEEVKRLRPKGNISWVSAEEAVRAEVRLYSHLFSVDSPDDKWEEQARGGMRIKLAFEKIKHGIYILYIIYYLFIFNTTFGIFFNSP